MAASTEFLAGGVRLRLNEPGRQVLDDSFYAFIEAHVAALERGHKSDDEALYHILLNDRRALRACHLGEPERDGLAAQFAHLVAACLVYADSGEQVFASADEYRQRQREPLAVAARARLERAFG